MLFSGSIEVNHCSTLGWRNHHDSRGDITLVAEVQQKNKYNCGHYSREMIYLNNARSFSSPLLRDTSCRDLRFSGSDALGSGGISGFCLATIVIKMTILIICHWLTHFSLSESSDGVILTSLIFMEWLCNDHCQRMGRQLSIW